MKKRNLIAVILILMLAVCVGVFSACDKIGKYIYDAPENIAYDGQYITWDKCDKADYYTVSINGGDETRVNSATFAYVSSDTFEVTVTAVYDKTKKASATTFKPLAKIENISIADNGAISWDAVSGATSYELNVNGQIVTTATSSYNMLGVGNNAIKVRPIVSGDKSFYSVWSDEKNINILSAPTNIKYDGEELSWIGNSATYEVSINGQRNVVSGNKFAYRSNNKDFSVTVKSLGNHTSTYDSVDVNEEFFYLDSITIGKKDGIVIWNPLGNAEGYKIKVDGKELNVTLTDTTYSGLSAGTAHTVQVMPFNNSGNYFSEWSNELTVHILESPVIEWNEGIGSDGQEAMGNIYWNLVNAASGYTYRLYKDSELIKEDFTGIPFKYEYSEVGVYTVEIKANGNASYDDSKYSTPIKVERLSAPCAKDEFIKSNAEDFSEGFIVNYERVSGAKGYRLYRGGKELEGLSSTGTSITVADIELESTLTQQTINYSIKSTGEIKTVNSIPYIVLDSAETLDFVITVLATPQNPTMEGFNLNWSAITGADRYAVKIGRDETGYSSFATADNTMQNMEKVPEGEHSVTVVARGNGKGVLASKPSVPVAILRLAKPENVRITSDANGTLLCDAKDAGSGYEALINNTTPVSNKNFITNMYQHIMLTGTSVSLRVTENSYNSDRTLYRMTSEWSNTKNFIRLKAPVFPEGAIANGNKLAWIGPDNINGAVYSPTYEVITSNMVVSSGRTDEGYDISNIEAGEHKYRVKAIGNETEYVDSEESLDFTFTKLATPEMKVNENGNGTYTWKTVMGGNVYELTIDDIKVSEELHKSGEEYSYTPRFSTIGAHTVKLKAVGNGKTTVSSKEFEYIQIAKQLEGLRMTYKFVENDDITDNSYGKIEISIVNPLMNCKKYAYEIGGTVYESSDTVYNYVINDSGEYTVRVKALGGTFDNDNVYYMDANFVGNVLSDKIVVLSEPNGFRMFSDGYISWNNVNGAAKYEYQIQYENNDLSNILETKYGESKIVVSDFADYQKITLKIRAVGDNEKVAKSKWVEWTWNNQDYRG